MTDTEQRLEEATATLRSFIAKSPKLSRTAAQAKRLLNNLERSKCILTTAEKLAIVRKTARNFANSRRLNNVLYHPINRLPKQGSTA